MEGSEFFFVLESNEIFFQVWSFIKISLAEGHLKIGFVLKPLFLPIKYLKLICEYLYFRLGM